MTDDIDWQEGYIDQLCGAGLPQFPKLPQYIIEWLGLDKPCNIKVERGPRPRHIHGYMDGIVVRPSGRSVASLCLHPNTLNQVI